MTSSKTRSEHGVKALECSICAMDYIGYGNNAWPVNDGQCCDNCNAKVVVPARFELHRKGRA